MMSRDEVRIYMKLNAGLVPWACSHEFPKVFDQVPREGWRSARNRVVETIDGESSLTLELLCATHNTSTVRPCSSLNVKLYWTGMFGHT